MNRKHLLGIGLLSAAMLLTGCSAEILDGHSGQVPIYLTASVQEGGAQGVTRAGTDVQSTQLPENETFYGYFPSGATVSSAIFTANGSGGTTANPQPYFTFSGTETTVHAYHGKSGGTAQVTNQTSSFTVATDQSDDEDEGYKASDLMYATATVTKSGLSATGALQFSHKMAKIIVNATMGSGITEITAVKIVGGSKTINIATPQSCTLGSTLSGDNSSANITVYSGTHTSGTLSCAALIPPQTVSGNFLQIVTDKGTVTYSLNGKQFDSNNVYTFTVTLTASQVGTTVAITDWANNGNVEVTVEGACNGVDITSSTKVAAGGYICSHGKYISSLSGCGGTALARITYVGSVPGYFDKFLAIAMEDASSSAANWTTQMSAANTWASNHPVTVDGTTYSSCSTSAYDQVTDGGSTSKPKSSGAEKGWRVPSVTDWKYIFAGIGGKTVDNSAVTGGIVYSTDKDEGGDDGSHRALLNKWCGQAWNATTKPQAVQSTLYWSSSERAEDPGNAWWGYRFSYSEFDGNDNTNTNYVRAVFAY